MQTIAHYAAAIILTSALGAFVLCLLVIRYGFAQSDDEPLPARHRRFFVTRLGHAVGAVCFAVTAGLAAVALTMASRAAPPVAPDDTVGASAMVDVTPLQARQTRLADDMRTLGERIERTEATLAELRATVRAPAPVASAPVDVTPLQAGQARLTHDMRALDERIERTEAALADLRAARAGAVAGAPADVAPLQAGQARLAQDVRALDERIRRTESALTQLRAAAAAPGGDRASRPVRRPTPAAPRDVEAERPAPTPRVEGEGMVTPGTPMDPAPAASPSTTTVAPSEPRRPADRGRSVKQAVSDLGDEVGKKAATAARAVRDFFRDL